MFVSWINPWMLLSPWITSLVKVLSKLGYYSYSYWRADVSNLLKGSKETDLSACDSYEDSFSLGWLSSCHSAPCSISYCCLLFLRNMTRSLAEMSSESIARWASLTFSIDWSYSEKSRFYAGYAPGFTSSVILAVVSVTVARSRE